MKKKYPHSAHSHQYNNEKGQPHVDSSSKLSRSHPTEADGRTYFYHIAVSSQFIEQNRSAPFSPVYLIPITKISQVLDMLS